MAINTQKLLPSSKKSSAITKVNAAKVIPVKEKTINLKKVSDSPEEKYSKTSKEDERGQIVKVLTDIDIRLKSILRDDQKQQVKKKKEKEKKEFEDAEKKLEAPKETKKFNLPKLSIPGASFLDRIKRFLLFTGLGWLFTKFKDQLPKLLGVIKVIGQVYGVVESVFKVLLESFVNFIEFGYKTYDKIRGIVKSIGGENAEKEFDNLSSKLNEYINYVLIGGMALTGAINAFNKSSGRATEGAAKEVAKRAATKGILQKTAQSSRIGARKATQAVVGKQTTRQLLRLVKGPLSKLPILGGLIEFGLSWALGDPVGKAAFRGIGTLLLGAVGSLILPGFGTFVGGVVGAELAGKLYEVLFENKKSKGSVQKKQNGGSVTRGGKPQGAPTRSIKVVKRRPSKIQPKQSQPGKDVGGEKKIREFYGKEMKPGDPGYYERPPGGWLANLGKKRLNEKPYAALVGAAKKLKEIPFGIGSLMGGAIDIVLGENLSRSAVDGLSNGISYLASALANNQITASAFSIQKEITKMQTGGVIPDSREFVKKNDLELGKDVNKILKGLIQKKADEAVREVQKKLLSIKPGDQKEGRDFTMPSPGAPGDGAGGYAEGEKNFVSSKEIYDYLRSKDVSHIHAMGMLANIQAESSFNSGAIGDSGTSGGLFQHHADRFEGMRAYAGKDWAKNWKRQVDYALREGAGKQYISKKFKTAEEASAWFTINFERPSNKEYKARERLGNLKNFDRDGSWKGPQPGAIQAPKTKLDLKKLGLSVGERAGYSQSRGRVHAGRDIAIAEGTPLRTLNDSVVVDIGYEERGYGHYIVFRDKNGRETLYGHLKDRPNRREGEKLLANSIVGYVGSTGRSTGPHLHWEVSDRAGEVGVPRKNVTDPLDLGYKPEDPFGGEINPKPQKEKTEKEKSFTRVINGQTWKRRPDGRWQTGSGRSTLIISNAELNQRILRSKPTQNILRKSAKISSESKQIIEKGTYTVGGITYDVKTGQPVKRGPAQKGYGNMQGGGLIGPKNRRNYSSLSTYPSYDSAGGMMIAIQPVIIEKRVPVSSGQNRTIMFPVPVSVNNNNSAKLRR